MSRYTNITKSFTLPLFFSLYSSMSLEYLKQIGQASEKVQQLSQTEVGKVATEFGAKAMQEMKDGAPTASGTLKSSITFEFKDDGSVLTVTFLADEYWDFINSGVDGVRSSAGALVNSFGNTYSFKSENPSPKMMGAFLGNPSMQNYSDPVSMQNWLASKGITSLTYGGQTHQLQTDADYRGAAYVLARATKRHGIKPTPFVNDALTEEKLQAFEQAILDAFETII